MIRYSIGIIFLIVGICIGFQSSFASMPTEITRMIENGDFTLAQQKMRMEMAQNPDLPAATRLKMEFEIERLDRIKKDFTKTEAEILAEIKRIIPETDRKMLRQWEQEKSLEYMVIDGKKMYFKWAANNLFRVNPAAKMRKKQVEQSAAKIPEKSPAFILDKHLAQVVETARKQAAKYVVPQRFRITYTLTVKPNVVVPGKQIRCWLPFPRKKAPRQSEIRLISTSPEKYILSDNTALQRSIYLEKTAQPDQSTDFQVVFEYTSHAYYQNINPLKIQPIENKEAMRPFLSEQPPHVVFTEELKNLAQKIVGDETNPYLKAKKLFEWFSQNIPWASAREYSTIPSLSLYCYDKMYGDCGIQTFLYITLARLSGIPAKWQSGWTTEPGDVGRHDWGEIYLAPYGWVPVDVNYGLRNVVDPVVRWFYLGNIDTYRLIVNDAWSQALYPSKIFPRSETVDFQLGEVEWEGGNLYYDQWDRNFEVEYLEE